MGGGLLKNVVLRSLSVSQHAGVKALLVHTLSEDAKVFYVRNGFLESPFDPMTLKRAYPSENTCLPGDENQAFVLIIDGDAKSTEETHAEQ